jgi:hypothetical protein
MTATRCYTSSRFEAQKYLAQMFSVGLICVASLTRLVLRQKPESCPCAFFARFTCRLSGQTSPYNSRSAHCFSRTLIS